MATIHPHKGYLNTKFQLLTTDSTALSYEIRKQGSNSIERNGTLQPSVPVNICLSSPGKYNAVFEDGSRSDFIVEDGFKFGGSSHKKSFVFDECPWIFIVMRDRTYFYNRDTGEEYVEYISPDEIIEISSDYVLMRNDGQEEVTLYSLTGQRPTICISNVLFHNQFYLVWRNNINAHKQELIIFSLLGKEEKMRKPFDLISVSDSSSQIFYTYNDAIHIIDIKKENKLDEQIFSARGIFGAFLQQQYAVYIEKRYGKGDELVIYDIPKRSEKSRFTAQGCIARINDNVFIDINKRRDAIRDFDLENSGFPEACINATYAEYDIYPCRTDTFYKEIISTISSSQRYVKSTCVLKSTESELTEAIGYCNNIVINDFIFCIYGHQKESIIIPLNYRSHMQHRHDGSIHSHNDKIILTQDGEYSILSRNGFWDKTIEGNFNFSYFDKFGIVIEKGSRIITNTHLGKFNYHAKESIDFIRAEKGLIFPNDDILYIDHEEHIPEALSPRHKYGVDVKDGKVKLYSYKDYTYGNPTTILENVFDSSEFKNVILSEDGRQIMYRDNECCRLIDLGTKHSTEFKNLSFINHINGMRPLFRLKNNSQAILINPINGIPVETDILDNYQFVSPDASLYADKTLCRYIEYYDHIRGEIISRDDYLDLCRRFNLTTFSEDDKKIVMQNRKEFVLKNGDFLINVLKSKGYKDRPTNEFIELLIEDKQLLDLFIEQKGIAVIRKTKNNSVVSRIQLGEPLWFLNYVSFSYDNRYVAIAGRYPFNNAKGYSGLFMVYDLINNEVIIDNKSSYAVWTTAFTENGIVAAYTSSPNSIVCSIDKLSSVDNQKIRSGENLFPIESYNFLSFSPDGKLFACSKQGYIPYRNIDGSTNSNWGHQPSSIVSIRMVDCPKEEIICYNDISDEGVYGTFSNNSVASISFSNNNSRLMMVGKDGCCIVRNLHLYNH